MGVGLIFGPLIGSFLYRTFGFEMTFYLYGLSECIIAILIRRFAYSEFIESTDSFRSN